MKYIFWLVVFFIIYGSLYPFNFYVTAPLPDLLAKLIATWSQKTHLGDILGNIVLFIPYGYFGLLYFTSKHVASLIFIGFILAIGVQVVQLYLPSREPALNDAIWNLLGIGFGLGMGLVHRFLPQSFIGNISKSANFPLLLLCSWLAYRLMPFIPSLDWQLFKDSLKPLLLYPDLRWTNVLHDAVCWLIVGCLWRPIFSARVSEYYLLLIIPITFCLEVVIVNNYISASNVIGALLGITLWFGVFRKIRGHTTVIAILLVAILITIAFAPFELRDNPATFHWIPFYGFLEGSMLINTAVVFEKFFLYGALLWLARQEGASTRFVTVFSVSVIMFIEIGQIYFGNRTPEITDPILVIIIATLILVLESNTKELKAKTQTE